MWHVQTEATGWQKKGRLNSPSWRKEPLSTRWQADAGGKGYPSPALQVIHAGSVGPSCHPVKVHQRSGTPRFLLSSATQACHFSLTRSLGCLALFQGQKRPVPGLKARREYWVVVHCFLHLGGCLHGAWGKQAEGGTTTGPPSSPTPRTDWLAQSPVHPPQGSRGKTAIWPGLVSRTLLSHIASAHSLSPPKLKSEDSRWFH